MKICVFLEKDTRNHLAKVRRMRLGEGDANAIQSYFLKMQSLNEGFFSIIDWDKKGRLKNVFWADPRSRAACREFGDVISFNTTYLTNMYDMPFAPFVGVNHHGQSILLGCGLISNEDTETFIWLFRTWLACMSGVAPSGIITDQDKAMKNAIAVVFPGTRHRLCLWHILKKVPEKLGSYTLYDDIAGALGNVVYDSQSIVDFESGWENMIQNFKLEDNAWLATLYEERAMWVPIFVKNFFWAGMSTTQRSESMNAFFDGYVNSKTTLKQFVEQYSNALRSKMEKESKADFDSFHKQVQCATFYEMEKQIQSLYTMAKFKEFQDELKGMVYCGIISVNKCGTVLQFVVVEDITFGEKGRKTMAWNVYCDASAYEVKCTCYRFEFRGIPCRHSLTVLIRNGVKLLPAQYIFTRWRKDVRRCHTRVKINYDGWLITSEQRRYDDLCKSFTKLADLAADNEEYFSSVKQLIEDEHQKLSANPRILMLPSSTSNDPIKKRGKGRPPSLRKQTIFKRKGKHNSIAEESPTQDKDSNQDMGSVDASTHEVEGGFLNLFMNVSQIALSEGGWTQQSSTGCSSSNHQIA